MLSVWDVFLRFGVDVFFGESEVNNIYSFISPVLFSSNQEIFWFDIPVDHVFVVYIFHSPYLQWNSKFDKCTFKNTKNIHKIHIL